MKLITYESNGKICSGVLHGDAHFIDVSAAGHTHSIMCDPAARAAAAKITASGPKLPLAGVRLFAPIVPGKIIAIGLNYRDHAAESGASVPKKPIVFSKLPNTLAGPGDTITWHSDQTPNMDFEAELGIVIGRMAYRVPLAEALNYVGGYVCANDLSARDLQGGDDGKQWVLGKGLDGTCPIGPCLVTADEVPDPQSLRIRCILNGQTVQDSNTSQMVFNTAQLVAHLSHHLTLYPGDLIVTGTPPGVGAARKPPLWLKDGDDCVIEIEKIGALRNRMRVL